MISDPDLKKLRDVLEKQGKTTALHIAELDKKYKAVGKQVQDMVTEKGKTDSALNERVMKLEKQIANARSELREAKERSDKG